MYIDDIEKGKNIIVVGAGSTVREYQDKIESFIHNREAVTIGINKITDFIVPKYHIWTNRQRWGAFGSCISRKSELLFGSSIKKQAIHKYYKGKVNRLSYTDRDGLKVDYKNGKICGHFRTAGCLAVMVAHVMGAKNIFIVGMDGFTLHREKDVKSGKASHHCYGKGYTDDAGWEACVLKDKLVDQALHNMSDYGVSFKIITPTKFVDFYDPDLLGIR